MHRFADNMMISWPREEVVAIVYLCDLLTHIPPQTWFLPNVPPTAYP
jgi:hypothetical protein